MPENSRQEYCYDAYHVQGRWCSSRTEGNAPRCGTNPHEIFLICERQMIVTFASFPISCCSVPYKLHAQS